MPGTGLQRGRVYAATLAHIEGEKYYLVVSSNRRNERLSQVLAVRLTTSPKPLIPTVVELDHREPLTGRVLCDDIEALYPDEVRRDMGALSPSAMGRVEAALRAALDL